MRCNYTKLNFAEKRFATTMKPAIRRIETVFLQLTSSCNLRCLYCYAYRGGSSHSLAFEKVNEILSALALRGSSVVIFSGGEPTLDKRLPQYIYLSVYDYGHRPGIVTNGVYLPKELLKAVRQCNAFIQFSLDALSHQIYTNLCGVDKLDHVLRNIERVLDAGIEVTLSFTATHENFIDLIPVVEFALSKGITSLHVGILVNSGRASCYRGLGGVSPRALWDVLYPVQLNYYEQIGIDLVEEFLLPFATGIKRHTFCAAMEGRGLEITSSGRVTACEMMPEESFTYGNLNQSGFDEILNSIDSNNYFDISRLIDCKTCQVRSICAGGCRALAFVSSGDPYGAYPYCDDNRKILDEVRKDIDGGKLDGYLDFLRRLPSEKTTSSKYF